MFLRRITSEMPSFSMPSNGGGGEKSKPSGGNPVIDFLKRRNTKENKEGIVDVETAREYVTGARQLFEHARFLAEMIRDQGENPIVVIPSRGAMPLFIAGRIAYEEHEKAVGRQTDVAHTATRFYPSGIFNYLSDGYIGEYDVPNPLSQVLIYPFTADIKNDREEGEDRTHASAIRRSAVEATVGLVKGEMNEDLAWTLFLTDQILNPLEVDSESRHYSFSPEAYVDGLVDFFEQQRLKNESGVPTRRNHIVLIDTVLSGTASSQILNHFADHDIPVTPILALHAHGSDSREVREKRARKEPLTREDLIQKTGIHGEKLDAILQAVTRIQQRTGDALLDIDYNNIFTILPLISEDRRPLLGLNALGIHLDPETEKRRFSDGHQGQDCIWTMAPEMLAHFHGLLHLAVMVEQGASDEMINDWLQQMQTNKAFDSRASFDTRVLKNLVRKEYLPKQLEISNSGIVRLHFSRQQSEMLVRRFHEMLRGQGMR